MPSQPIEGAVVILGCSVDELTDIYELPKGAKGPYVISGNNRFVLCFFSQVFRRIICLELMNEFPHEDYKWRKFWMKVYCFPDPKDPAQRLAIRAIGSMENEVQQNFIKMSDARSSPPN